ncbi:MAG: DUF1080 domain-containing protein [Dehalococcoidia bacterium]|nr:DUF1080 domain-containing protein [Dehalococcoidia bacterium]
MPASHFPASGKAKPRSRFRRNAADRALRSSAPAVNASKPAGEWQTLDVTLIGRDVTVVLNGIKVIDKGVIEGLTAMGHDPHEDQPGPISIQGDHRKVEIRKLVVTPLVKG